ncbi:MAG: PEP-CTERM sorting domain-containing protein [Phycisphaerae bacterium]|nr:PEP-CTERM sorting domain-containing protein [Phycisphaerae bacterium]
MPSSIRRVCVLGIVSVAVLSSAGWAATGSAAIIANNHDTIHAAVEDGVYLSLIGSNSRDEHVGLTARVPEPSATALMVVGAIAALQRARRIRVKVCFAGGRRR